MRDLLPGECPRLLDLGCGPGTFLGRAAPRFRRALGIDLTPAQIAYARDHVNQPGLAFEVADLRSLDAGLRFDAVVGIEVIEHLPEEETSSFLRRVFAHLKAGGILVLSTPNYRSHWLLLERLVSWLGPVDYTAQHVNRFDRKRLEEELGSVGFEQVSVSSFFLLAPFFGVVSTRLA